MRHFIFSLYSSEPRWPCRGAGAKTSLPTSAPHKTPHGTAGQHGDKPPPVPAAPSVPPQPSPTPPWGSPAPLPPGTTALLGRTTAAPNPNRPPRNPPRRERQTVPFPGYIKFNVTASLMAPRVVMCNINSQINCDTF